MTQRKRRSFPTEIRGLSALPRQIGQHSRRVGCVGGRGIPSALRAENRRGPCFSRDVSSRHRRSELGAGRGCWNRGRRGSSDNPGLRSERLRELGHRSLPHYIPALHANCGRVPQVNRLRDYFPEFRVATSRRTVAGSRGARRRPAPRARLIASVPGPAASIAPCRRSRTRLAMLHPPSAMPRS